MIDSRDEKERGRVYMYREKKVILLWRIGGKSARTQNETTETPEKDLL